MGTMATKACFSENLTPCPWNPNQSPLSASSARKGHSRSHGDAGRPPWQGQQEERGDKKGVLPSPTRPEVLTGDAGGRSWGEGVDCPPRGLETDGKKTREPHEEAVVSQSRYSPAPGARRPGLPGAGDAQALPVHEAASPVKGGAAVSSHDPPPAAVSSRRPQQGGPHFPWLPRAQWPPFRPELVGANRRSHRHLRISLWWEKRGGGTAEGSTRGGTCAVSSATAARGRELARAGAAVRSTS
ncbi:hypothetical protein AAY473_017685 [Plecturocebus cupreus]